jgi:hypothetical protein
MSISEKHTVSIFKAWPENGCNTFLRNAGFISSKLCGDTSQKRLIFILATVRTSNLVYKISKLKLRE